MNDYNNNRSNFEGGFMNLMELYTSAELELIQATHETLNDWKEQNAIEQDTQLTDLGTDFINQVKRDYEGYTSNDEDKQAQCDTELIEVKQVDAQGLLDKMKGV